MKYHIEYKNFDIDSHCSCHDKPTRVVVDENGNEIGYFGRKEYDIDSHCADSDSYEAIFDKNGVEIGHFVKEYPYMDTHCGGKEEPTIFLKLTRKL